MKLKTEEEIFSEYLKLRKRIDDQTAIYLIYQMGFIEGAAPITGAEPELDPCDGCANKIEDSPIFDCEACKNQKWQLKQINP